MTDIRRYEMLVRVKEFGAAHAELFPATTLGGSLFAAVGDAVDEVTSHGTTQAHRTTERDGDAKNAVLAMLRESLLRIGRTARAAAVDVPGLVGKFRVPPSHSEQRMLLTARAFLQDAPPFRDQFVAHRLPPTFLDDLAAEIAALERLIQGHATAKESHAAARAGISDALAAGSAAVERLDAVVRNTLEHQPDALAAWHSARRVSTQSIPYPSREKAPAPSAPPVAA